jgi:hypothetical protein
MPAAPLILQEHLQALAIQRPFAVAGRALSDTASCEPCAGSVRHIRRIQIACATVWLMTLVKTAHRFNKSSQSDETNGARMTVRYRLPRAVSVRNDCSFGDLVSIVSVPYSGT